MINVIVLIVQSQKGILKAILVADGAITLSSSSNFDQIGILANLHALIGQCQDICEWIVDYSIHVNHFFDS